MHTEVHSEDQMREFGKKLGALFAGGEVLELVGDVGAGKTTLTKGIAVGMGIDETVQSPTFTINRMYDAPSGVRLAHYDFYRLPSAGIMADELHEVVNDTSVVTIVEWADVVDGVLPDDRLRIRIVSPTETSRQITIEAEGEKSLAVLKGLA